METKPPLENSCLALAPLRPPPRLLRVPPRAWLISRHRVARPSPGPRRSVERRREQLAAAALSVREPAGAHGSRLRVVRGLDLSESFDMAVAKPCNRLFCTGASCASGDQRAAAPPLMLPRLRAFRSRDARARALACACT